MLVVKNFNNILFILLQELVKGDRQSRPTPSLFDKMQGISLEELEIGRLIGKGCNAAVHEARLRTAYNGIFLSYILCFGMRLFG